MPCITNEFAAPVYGPQRAPISARRRGPWLRCETRKCKRDAQYMCKACGALVCGRHGAAASEEEQYCADCGKTAGVTLRQPELF